MHQERPRLLLLITDLILGGAARVARDHAEMLSPRFEVHQTVFNTADGVGVPGPVPHSLGTGGGGSPLRKLLNLRERVKRTRDLKRQLNIAVSISHLEGAHWVDVLSRQRDRVILTVHGSILHNRDIAGVTGWLRKHVLTPFIYNRADRVVTVSRDIGVELVRLGVRPGKIRTINNSFDHERIRALAAEPLGPTERLVFDDVPTLVTVGRLHAVKNHEALLSVFADLVRQLPARLVIIGGGELGPRLVDHARALGLSTWCAWEGLPLVAGRQVYFLGTQPNPYKFVARSDVFVLSSTSEGFPLALCEAMICERPVASSDCQTGPREILSPDSAAPAQPISGAEVAPYGLLLPVLHDPARSTANRAAWVAALCDLLNDPGRRAAMARNGRLRMEDFSRATVSRQWFLLIAEVIAAGISG